MYTTMKETLILVLGSSAGAIVTFVLQKNGFSAVLSSSLVGLIGAGIGHYLSMPHLSAVIFAGSFVGMTSISLGSMANISAAGILTGLIYSFSLNIFSGLGGRLGTIALISTTICIYLMDILFS
jgi:hypothetical protein